MLSITAKTEIRKPCRFVDLPLTDYRDALDLQRNLLDLMIRNELDSGVVLLLEHPPVFTIGRRGNLKNLMVSKSFLKDSGISVIQVERGGDITYHGPGQIVVYPIVHLPSSNMSAADYVAALETVMIDTVGLWGIHATTNSANRGAWVADRKVGSIGIAVRRSVTFHGFALNVNNDLTPFDWIHPCGLKQVKITSISNILGRPIDMNDIRNKVKSRMSSVFGVQFESISPEALKMILPDLDKNRSFLHDNDNDPETTFKKLYKRHENTAEPFFV